MTDNYPWNPASEVSLAATNKVPSIEQLTYRQICALNGIYMRISDSGQDRPCRCSDSNLSVFDETTILDKMINAIKVTAAKAGKKYYEVLIGKLNEPKLKNF